VTTSAAASSGRSSTAASVRGEALVGSAVEGGVAETGGRHRLVEVVVEGGETGLVLAVHAGEQLVAARDEAGVLLLHLHRLLHRQPDDAHREAGQGLRQLACLVEQGGGQACDGADYFRDLSGHGHSLPHNPRRDTRCVQIHPSRRPCAIPPRAGGPPDAAHLPWVHG
jgi:hypothetical protein